MAITIVQTKGTAPVNATSISTTITAPASTSQLVAVGYTDALNAAISISALTGQVWSKVLGVDGGANQHDIFAWITTTSPGTGTTVTVNNGSAQSCSLVVIELAGTANSGTADGSSTSPVAPATTTTFACASRTPAVANDIDISWFCDLNDGGALTNPTGYTVDANGTQTAVGQRLVVARKIKTDSAAEAPSWTTTTSTTHGFAGQILVTPASGSFVARPELRILQAVNQSNTW